MAPVPPLAAHIILHTFRCFTNFMVILLLVALVQKGAVKKSFYKPCIRDSWHAAGYIVVPKPPAVSKNSLASFSELLPDSCAPEFFFRLPAAWLRELFRLRTGSSSPTPLIN